MLRDLIAATGWRVQSLARPAEWARFYGRQVTPAERLPGGMLRRTG